MTCTASTLPILGKGLIERALKARTPPADVHGRPRRAARHRGRGRRARRRVPLHRRRPGQDRAEGTRRARSRGGAGRGDHRDPGRRLPALARNARAGADDRALRDQRRDARGATKSSARCGCSPAATTRSRCSRRCRTALTNKFLHAPTQALNEAPTKSATGSASRSRPPATRPRSRQLVAAGLRNEAVHCREAGAACRRGWTSSTRLLSGEDATRRPGQLPQAHARARRDRAGGRALSAVHAGARRDVAAAQEMLARPGDARVRRGRDPARRASAWRRSRPSCRSCCCRKDPNDERNIFLEIRAGTGGDESALFAGDLFRMYTRYAERNRWQVEIDLAEPVASSAATRK